MPGWLSVAALQFEKSVLYPRSICVPSGEGMPEPVTTITAPTGPCDGLEVRRLARLWEAAEACGEGAKKNKAASSGQNTPTTHTSRHAYLREAIPLSITGPETPIIVVLPCGPPCLKLYIAHSCSHAVSVRRERPTVKRRG